MTALGATSLVAGGLQLGVPSYALRLVRRFGTERVGWFVVTAFCSLAVLHLVGPAKLPAGPASGVMVDVMYAVIAVLLLIGMGHMEALFSERDLARSAKENLRNNWESKIQSETTDLLGHNQKLHQELTWRKQKEMRLVESEAQHRFLFAENPQPMLIFDLRTGRLLSVNKAALKQYGFSAPEFLTLNIRELLAPESNAAFLEDVAKPCCSAQSRGHWQHRRKDRTLIDVEITAMDLKFGDAPARLILTDDVTRHHQREAALCRSQRVAVSSQLAAGVAHHFNNLLAIIEGNTELLRFKPQDAEAQAELKEISVAVNRGATLTNQLLAVGGRLPMQLTPLDLNELIRNASSLLRRLAGQDIVIQNHYGQHLPLVLGDSHLVEKVLVNLVLNARDALRKGGTINITTAIVRDEPTPPRQQRHRPAGDCLRLAVRDSGCGMTPEVEAHVFEAFFTTHDIGQGMGLGLAGVYGMVMQLGGYVEFDTEPGIGTEFRVYLPCAPASAVATRVAAPVAAVPAPTSILLIERDDRARTLTRSILNRQGYRVIEADGPATALVLWDGQAANISLLLTDLVLPDGTSGNALAEQLRQSKPQLKVIYTLSANASAEIPVAVEGLKVLTKGCPPKELLQAVEDSLGAHC